MSNEVALVPQPPRRDRTISLSMLAGLFGIAFQYQRSTDTILAVGVQPSRIVNFADLPDDVA